MDTTTTTDLTSDALEQRLLNGESTIARVRAARMTIIREMDRRQAPLADGSRSLAEWVTARLDVAPETAKTLVSTARRLEALPTVEQATTDGTLSFDRTVAVARIAIPSEDTTIISELSGYDVAAIRRLRSNRHRMTRDIEREAFDRRYMVAQPNLDESSWRVYGQLPAVAGRVFVEALDAKADQLPRSAHRDGSRTTRYADALWAMSLDSSTSSMCVLSTEYRRRQAARCSRSRVHDRPVVATPTPTIPPTTDSCPAPIAQERERSACPFLPIDQFHPRRATSRI